MEHKLSRTAHSYSDLLSAWTSRIIKARYKQSLLGGLWAVIQPASSAILFGIIFTRFVPIATGDIPYIIVAYSALVPWTFFSNSISDMVNSLVDNMSLVTKIYFPREILPVAALLARALDFLIGLALLFVLIVVFQVGVFPALWPALLVALMAQCLLSLGVGLLGASLNVFYRDTKHVAVLGVQLLMYASPVIYPASVVPDTLRALYFMNPMAGIIETYRGALLYGQVEWKHVMLAFVLSLGLFVVGYAVFKRLEPDFADCV